MNSISPHQTSTQWYVVQTHPHAESRAATHLNRQGYGVFFPRYKKERRHARRLDIVEAPLFPGYLFVALDMAASRWQAVKSTMGVRRLVTAGDRPLAVPPQVICDLQARADTEGLYHFDEQPSYQPGDALVITEGPFKDCIGLFAERDDQRRVILLLDLLGRSLRLPIAAHAVQPQG